MLAGRASINALNTTRTTHHLLKIAYWYAATNKTGKYGIGVMHRTEVRPRGQRRWTFWYMSPP